MSPVPNRDPTTEPPDPRTYFAAERTLLAWIRTGLAMMGFGFVVARFGLFLRELAAAEGNLPQQPFAGSLWIGTTLVALGVVINLTAAAKHWQVVGRLVSNQPIVMRRTSLATLTALVMGILGVLIAAYLVVEFQRPATPQLPAIKAAP